MRLSRTLGRLVVMSDIAVSYGRINKEWVLHYAQNDEVLVPYEKNIRRDFELAG